MILITGVAGYIGSHVALQLIRANKDFVGFDNLSTGLNANNHGLLYVGDLRYIDDIEHAFKEVEEHGQKIDTVIHMAALTSVPESMSKKEEYTKVNFEGTENLIEVMKRHNCNKLIFSSTASVYKQSNEPVKEIDPIELLNNYALTKRWAEEAIKHNRDWLNAVIFRYFNVIGYDKTYDKSKELAKTNLVPSLLRSLQSGEQFIVYGNCYSTKRQNPDDHTCVRDYIDVRDIAKAHINAIDYLENHEGQYLFNLGTKTGYSVLELIHAFMKANNIDLSYTISGPRKGDPASVVADNQKAVELLGWTPSIPIEESLKVL